jgi:hypothetical protein
VLEESVRERAARLAACEAQVRTFFDHSSECHAVLAKTGSGGFSYEKINPTTLRLYELTCGQVVGRKLENLIGCEAAAQVGSHLRACLGANTPQHYERCHGDHIVEAIATPVRAKPVPCGGSS